MMLVLHLNIVVLTQVHTDTSFMGVLSEVTQNGPEAAVRLCVGWYNLQVVPPVVTAFNCLPPHCKGGKRSASESEHQ